MPDDRPGGLGRNAPDAFITEFHRDSAAALRGLRAARGIFTLLLAAALLLHTGAFVAVFEYDLTGDREQAQRGFTPIDQEPNDFAQWLDHALPLSRFVGLVSAGLLVLTFLLAAHVCLAARVPGAAGATSAALWMLIVLVLVFPWRHWVGGDWSWTAFLTPTELHAVGGLTPKTTLEQALTYGRYVGYPALGLLTLLVAWLRFSAGHAAARRQLLARMEGRVA